MAKAIGFLGKMGWKPSLRNVEETSTWKRREQVGTNVCHEGAFCEDFNLGSKNLVAWSIKHGNNHI